MSDGDIIDYTKESSIRLDYECAWRPMRDVYDIFCGSFGLEMVFMAEESGCGIYYSTDTEEQFLIPL